MGLFQNLKQSLGFKKETAEPNPDTTKDPENNPALQALQDQKDALKEDVERNEVIDNTRDRLKQLAQGLETPEFEKPPSLVA